METAAEPLRAHAEKIESLGNELYADALSGHYVVQPSQLLKLEQALEWALSLEDGAKAAGLEAQWETLVAVMRSLHHEMLNRTREPEAMTEGAPFVRLIQSTIDAANVVLAQFLPVVDPTDRGP